MDKAELFLIVVAAIIVGNFFSGMLLYAIYRGSRLHIDATPPRVWAAMYLPLIVVGIGAYFAFFTD